MCGNRTDFNNPNHPCYGKSCNECESCIFDVEIPFNKDNKKMSGTCNYCSHLGKEYLDNDRYRFTAQCRADIIQCGLVSRPRNIEFDVWEMKDINTPSWCPKLNGKLNEEAKYLPSVTTIPKKTYTYQEKRDIMKSFPRNVEWDDIKVGEFYVVPKIYYQERKIVLVDYKSELMCRCKEVSCDGTVSSSIVNIYHNDIDAIMLVKLHKF